MSFPLVRLRLENGLRVLLHEDHAAPVVAVNLWYHVGSKDERPGRTGLAHLFEHMLFQGSEHVGDDQHFALVQQRGGVANGSTWFDRTNYHETLPARELELALWLESDRMGFLLPALTQRKLDNQREVVKNERRWRVDNQPYGTWLERGLELLFPRGHPYRWPVIGYMEDLDAASLDDVRAFFRAHYLPGNAVLTVAGDFEAARGADLVAAYFSGIPGGPEPPRVDARLAPPARERRAVIEDQVQLPRLYALWTVPPFGTAEWTALDFATDLLSSGRSSRLYRSLVHERELAKDVSAFTFNTEEAGVVVAALTVRPGVEVAAAAAGLDAEIDRLRAEPPGKGEMARTLNRIETQFAARLESAERKADLLSMYATYFDEPERLTTEIERYRALTADAVHAAASARLDRERRVLLTYVPRASRAAVALPAPVADRGRVPGSGAEPPWRLPCPSRFRLASGLELVVARVARVPTVAVRALLDAGALRDPEASPGLAALSVALLEEGTRRRSSLEIAEAVESLGASIACSAGPDSAAVTLATLARTFAEAWAITAEILTEPVFPEREVERLRQEQLAQVIENRAQPAAVADVVLARLLYGAHPYARPVLGSETSLRALGRESARAFALEHVRPETTRILVAGDVDPEEVAAEVERALGGWRGSGLGAAPVPEAPARSERRFYLVDRPGAPQSELRTGGLALPRSSPDWVACEVLNGILGGKFTSRINLNLRERHGFTYGARTWFAARRARGPFLVATAVHTRATRAALVEIAAELDRIRQEPVAAAELDDTRSYLQGVFPLTVETASDVVARLAEIELFGLPADEFDRYRERVAAVTAGDVLELARRHVRPEEMPVLVVGDAAQVRGPLEELGEVTLVDESGDPA